MYIYIYAEVMALKKSFDIRKLKYEYVENEMFSSLCSICQKFGFEIQEYTWKAMVIL